jgi:hypothetical protein
LPEEERIETEELEDLANIEGVYFEGDLSRTLNNLSLTMDGLQMSQPSGRKDIFDPVILKKFRKDQKKAYKI